MRPRIAAVIGMIVAVSGAAGGMTADASAAPGRGTAVAGEHRHVVDFWTDERRAGAVPRQVAGPTPAAKPEGKPGKGGGGGGGDDGGGTAVVTGAVWRQGGSVTLTTGKVFFTLGASRYTCSASAVATPAGNAVLTAGHCVHAGNGGAFATNWIFYPGWDGAPDPDLGAWTATDLFTTEGWAGSGDFDDDAGFALVTGGGSASLAEVLAGRGTVSPAIAFGTTDADVHAFGYPAAKKYKGNTLTYCAGPTVPRYDGHETLALSCDMTGGSSGGPWFSPFANDGAADAIVSLNSYGYASLSNVMFGPIFDGAEQATYTATAGGACPVGPTTGYRCTS